MAQGGAKFFPFGDFRKIYVQVELNVDFHDLEARETGEIGSAVVYRPGVLVGWRWVIAERAAVTAGGGLDYIEIHARAGEEEGVLTAIWPRLDLNVGLLF